MEDDKERLNQTRQSMINAIGETMDVFGIAPSTGRLYATMFFHEEPMSLDEMAEAMEMSKTSMSARARNLQNIKMVEKMWQKGVRKDLYRASPDFFNNFISFICHSLRREIDACMKAIEEVEPVYQKLLESEDEEVRIAAKKDFEKINNAKNYFKWLDKLHDFFQSGEVFEHIPRD